MTPGPGDMVPRTWKGQPKDGGGSCLESSQGFGPCEFDPRPFRVDDDERCPHWKPPRSLFFALPVRRCAECEAEEHAAWLASVQARFAEALLHIASGLDPSWDRLPCLRYPDCAAKHDPWLPPYVTVSRR